GALEAGTGFKAELSSSGRTSEARFIASYCPVIEFGLVGQTMHQVDERTPVADLEKLTRVYRGVLERYFGGLHSSPSPRSSRVDGRGGGAPPRITERGRGPAPRTAP